MPRLVITDEEQDAFTGWRRYLYWQRGELRKIKRRSSKRDRRRGRAEIRAQRDDQGPGTTNACTIPRSPNGCCSPAGGAVKPPS